MQRIPDWKMTLVLVVSLAGVSAAMGQAAGDTSKNQAFEVASMRMSPPDPGRTTLSPPGASTFVVTNAPLKILIQLAYEVDANKIVGKQEWFGSEYDISAKAEGGVGLTYKQLQTPLQQLLADRLHLVMHRETREVDGYALVVAKGGPKLMVSNGGSATPTMAGTELKMQNMPLWAFAILLGKPANRPVVDKTGLTGNFDVDLKFATPDSIDSELPSSFRALQEQLGLKLELQKIPVEMLVVDHVEKVPTEN
jgi:uncharacterized protein (TIGR03435 family)